MEYLVFGSIILGFCVIAYSAYTATNGDKCQKKRYIRLQ